MAMHVPADARDDTMRELEARGVVPPSTGLARTSARPCAAFICDPAGNAIELTDVDPT
jgi:hypothetical protein